jgi:hypothetical protein
MRILQRFTFFALLLCALPLCAQQPFTPIDRFNAERDFTLDIIVEKNIESATDFLKYVVRQFELPKEAHLAVLANGEFMGAVRGNGTFEYSTGRNNFEQYVKLPDISLIEARYKPNYYVPNDPLLYKGYINFKVSPLPNFKKAREEPIDTAISSALLAIRNEKKPRLGTELADLRPQWGLLMGSRASSSPLLLGVPIQVHMDEHWSVQSDWMYGRTLRSARFIARPDGSVIISDFVGQMLEVDIQVKFHVTQRYPRLYFGTGGYVQRYFTRESAQFSLVPGSQGVIRQQRNAVGWIGSFGIEFQSGWNFNLNLSFPVWAFEDALFLQNRRGVGFMLQYYF